VSEPFVTREEDSNEAWISVSDLMSGTMLVFLAIALFFMLQIQNEQREIEDVAKVYDNLKTELYKDLIEEFKDDLQDWGAEIEQDTLTVRFREPDVLFDLGSAGLKPRFIRILDDFFPRYVKILKRPEYEEHIEEIRIEGHTSSVWRFDTSEDSAYLLNMDLSQRRTRSVLANVLFLSHEFVARNREWLKIHITANGLSSSKLILVDGKEDPQRSQRVDFRIRTDAEEQMNEIFSHIKESGNTF
jgi:outer membrane protein OmpA-like peptidoglycan-associated protein